MTEFKLPELGENIEQGDLVRLMIAPGADVKEGQPVMELETDKAVIEVPSSVSGVVSEIRVKEGDKLKVGQVIFTVENGAGGAKTVPAETKVSSGKPPADSKRIRWAKRGRSPLAGTSKTFDQPPPRRLSRANTSAPATPSAQHREPPNSQLPELGENIDQGDLVRLMITPGANVSEGQPVMELETEKAVVEVPSSVTGVVKEIKVKEGDKVKVGQVIFTLEGGAQRRNLPKALLDRSSSFWAASRPPCLPSRHEGRGQDRRAGSASGSSAARAANLHHACATWQSSGH